MYPQVRYDPNQGAPELVPVGSFFSLAGSPACKARIPTAVRLRLPTDRRVVLPILRSGAMCNRTELGRLDSECTGMYEPLLA